MYRSSSIALAARKTDTLCLKRNGTYLKRIGSISFVSCALFQRAGRHSEYGAIACVLSGKSGSNANSGIRRTK